MFFSESELFAILSKHLPEKDPKDIEDVARSILDTGKHWQEVDLHNDLHDHEKEHLHNLVKRKSNEESQKEIRVFYKE